MGCFQYIFTILVSIWTQPWVAPAGDGNINGESEGILFAFIYDSEQAFWKSLCYPMTLMLSQMVFTHVLLSHWVPIVFASLLLLPVVLCYPRLGRRRWGCTPGVRSREGTNTDSERFQCRSSLLGKKKKVWDFYTIVEIKLPQECFYLVLLKLAATAGVLWLAKSTCH